MRGEEFLEKMEYVAEDLIEEAGRPRKKKKRKVIALGGLAAGLAVAAGAAFYLGPGTEQFPLLTADSTEIQGETTAGGALPSVPAAETPSAAPGRETPPVQTEELPLLTVSDGLNEGMGFEGMMAYEVSELVSGNPWKEGVELSTLPVYKNKLTFQGETGRYVGGDPEARKARLLDMAGRLGLDAETLTITDNAPDEAEREQITEKFASVGESVPEGYFDPTLYVAEGNGLRLEMEENMTVTVQFDPAVALPEGILLYQASYGELEKTAEYLKSAYSGFLGMERPQTVISGGEYNIYGEQSYEVSFYEGSGSLEEQIVQYNFYRTSFYDWGEGLSLARAWARDLSEKVGDYPIISADEARELLADGNYITTVCDPEKMPGMDYVEKVELVYRTGDMEEYFMPYYRFLVELPGYEREGLRTYGAYYVPAVDAAYLTGLPVWDGRFN